MTFQTYNFPLLALFTYSGHYKHNISYNLIYVVVDISHQTEG